VDRFNLSGASERKELPACATSQRSPKRQRQWGRVTLCPMFTESCSVFTFISFKSHSPVATQGPSPSFQWTYRRSVSRWPIMVIVFKTFLNQQGECLLQSWAAQSLHGSVVSVRAALVMQCYGDSGLLLLYRSWPWKSRAHDYKWMSIPRHLSKHL